ncbi:hypothetical protein J6590_047565 [Homalodisca vitripennis]|nr:hypothetical protein J6590_047565 [Homalodisca vitripennis]
MSMYTLEPNAYYNGTTKEVVSLSAIVVCRMETYNLVKGSWHCRRAKYLEKKLVSRGGGKN